MQARILLLPILWAFVLLTHGQGTLSLQNRSISAPDGSIYNAPVFVDVNGNGVADAGEGLGTVAMTLLDAPAQLGLFVPERAEPIAIAQFRTSANGEFLGNPSSQTVIVPGYDPGTRAPLTIKVWVGASYETSPIRSSWSFVSQPLGGVVNDTPVFPPGVFGWGDAQTGSGFLLPLKTGPIAVADRVLRPFGEDARIDLATLLANDSDPGGSPLSIVSLATLSTNGATITRSANGLSLTYLRNDEQNDSFSYVIQNSEGALGFGRVDVVAQGAFIIFQNRTIPRSSGVGAYDAPVYVDANMNGRCDALEGIGNYAAALPTTLPVESRTAYLGLYLRDAPNPLAVVEFQQANGAFIATTGRVVAVPGFVPGQRAPMTVKAWIGSSVRGSWDFVSAPLGGVSAVNGVVSPTPGMTGWGNENGTNDLFVASTQRSGFGALDFTRVSGEELTLSTAALEVTAFLNAATNSEAGGTVSVDASSRLHYFLRESIADSFLFTHRDNSGHFDTGRVNVVTGGAFVFGNSAIPGAAGGSTYAAPVYVDANFDGQTALSEALGAFAWNQFNRGANVGLYTLPDEKQLAFGIFPNAFHGRFDTQNIIVPGAVAGQTVRLRLRIWAGAAGYAEALIKQTWDFDSRPLGGRLADGSQVPSPGLHVLGNDTTLAPVLLSAGEKPVLNTDRLLRLPGQVIDPLFVELLANDYSPSGGELTMVSVDARSNRGATIGQTGPRLHYFLNANVPDWFSYVARNAAGGYATGRVEIIMAGILELRTQKVRRSVGDGSVYDIPVFVDANFDGVRNADEGIGFFATNIFKTNAMLGLFLRNQMTTLATASFRTDAGGAFLPDGLPPVTIPEVATGARVWFTVRVWVGARFETAALKASWDFLSAPLGGIALDGTVTPTPGLTGLGDEETSAGIFLTPGVKPLVGTDVLTRMPGGDVKIPWRTLLQNDGDPAGGSLTFDRLDAISAAGATVARSAGGDWVAYFHLENTPDFFSYTARNSLGGYAVGRVDVMVGDADTQSSARVGVTLDGAGAHLAFHGIPEKPYLVQWRESLGEPGSWIDLGLAAHLGAGTYQFLDPNGSSTRFYRIVYRP